MTGSVAAGPGGGGTDRIRAVGVFVWAIAAAFFLYEFFLRTFFGSLEPQIMKSLQLNAATFSVLGSCYYLTYGLMQIPVGIVVDRFGVKATTVFAASVCGASALLFAAAQGFALGLAARLLMGFGSSFAFIILLVIAREWFPRKNFGLFAGLSQFVGTLGPILAGGPLVLVITREHVDWRVIISGLGFAGFVIAVLGLLFVRGRKSDDPDRLRLLLPRLGVGQQVKMLLKNRQAWFVALYSALIYTSIATLGAIWGTRVLIAKGLTQETAGDAVSVLWIGYAVGCPLAGFLSDTLRRRRSVLVGMALLAFLATGSLRIFEEGGLPLFGTIFFVIGFAGGAQNVGFATIVEKVTDRLSATSMGLNNGLMLLFDTVNPVIFGLLVTITLKNKDTENFTAENFDWALAYIPGLCLVALLVSVFLIRETYCKPQQDVVLLDPSGGDRGAPAPAPER
jgi:MFS family permease